MNGDEDDMIVREADKLWRDLNMRPHINKDIETVRAEARAGRLGWTQRDVKNLIAAYPKHKATDEVIERQGDHIGAALGKEGDDEKKSAVADGDEGVAVAEWDEKSEPEDAGESDSGSSDREALQAEWNAKGCPAVAEDKAQDDVEPEHELYLCEAEHIERLRTLVDALAQ